MDIVKMGRTSSSVDLLKQFSNKTCAWYCYLMVLFFFWSVYKFLNSLPTIFFYKFYSLAITFRFVIQFELIFVYTLAQGSFYPFACGYPVVPASFVGKVILSPIEWSWHLCLKWPNAHGSVLESQFYFTDLICFSLWQHYTVLII
jgi:hypothetical protein